MRLHAFVGGTTMHIGDLAMQGAVSHKIIRQHSGLRRIFNRVERRASETGRLLDSFQMLYQKLSRPDQFAAEIDTLENRLGTPSLLKQIRDEDRAKVLREYFRILAARSISKVSGAIVMDSCLSLGVVRNGVMTPLGIASMRSITNAGVAFLVDAFQNLTEIDLFHFHGLGTGTNAENVTDTALQTELTTEYTGNVRANGTQTESSAPVYVTVGTNTLDSGTPAVTEHGIFTATTAGTLWDRSVFAAINLVGTNGDGLQSSYSLTCSAGG